MGLFVRRCVVVAGFAVLSGCAADSSNIRTSGARCPGRPSSPYALEQCKLDVSLEPATHRLEATAALTMTLRDKSARATGAKLLLELHRDLGIDSVTSGGNAVAFRRLPDAAPTSGGEGNDADKETEGPSPALYELDWSMADGSPGDLAICYGGTLFQDVQAGEKAGEIHNFEMRAHVGEDGIYLGDNGAWYPRPYERDEAEPTQESPLTMFEVTVSDVPGMVLVACGNRDGAKLDAPRGERTTWRSPFALQGMALVGGTHQVFQKQVGDVLVSVHLGEATARQAPSLLDAITSYLKLYQPLIGAYPFSEFTLVENFFSSGFAFPGFTVIDAKVFARPGLVLRPGLLDHEMLHNWWGNGVYVSSLDGNWCEALTSYCANYMRHVLEGRPDKARAYRRNACYGLSRLGPEDDKPLGNFGKDDGPNRLIGYNKGAMVFAMLADTIGQDAMWRALRRLTTERTGKPTTWKDIQRAAEVESHRPLGQFFDQWVRGIGIAEIVIDEARHDERARRVEITLLQQGEHVIDITVPLRLVYEDGAVDETVVIDRPAQVATPKCLIPPEAVELDPEFRILRRVPPGELMPTISGIGKSMDLLIVQSKQDGGAYATVAERLEERYEEAEDTAVRRVDDATLKPADFKKGHALVLGKACLAPAVQDILKDKPIGFGDGFFSIDEQRYDKPTQEVLCCVRNPHDPGAVICLYYGNSAADLKKTGVLMFYGGNSLVVFEDGRPGLRRDFEAAQRVAVKTGD